MKLPTVSARRDDPKLIIKALVILVAYFTTQFIYITNCNVWIAILHGFLSSQVGVNIMHDGNHSGFTSNKTIS